MHDYAVMIKALRWCDDVGKCSECPEDFDCAEKNGSVMREAADAIEELVAAVPKWISAKKPPEKPNYYWCNVENIAFPGRYYQEKLWYDSEYFVNADGIVILRVTHYMPLPEPPKEDVNNGKVD